MGKKMETALFERREEEELCRSLTRTGPIRAMLDEKFCQIYFSKYLQIQSTKLNCSNIKSLLQYIKEAAQAEASPERSQDLRSCWTTSFSFPSHPFHNYCLPSVPNLSHRPSPSSHTFYSCLFHIILLSLIFKQSFSLLLFSFTLFSFPNASCWIFLP